MTIQIKARDLALAALLIAVGVLIGLSFRAVPSQAQALPAGSGYVENGNTMYYCQQTDCYQVRWR